MGRKELWQIKFLETIAVILFRLTNRLIIPGKHMWASPCLKAPQLTHREQGWKRRTLAIYIQMY